MCNIIIVIIDKLTKVTKYIIIEETIIVTRLAYEVKKALIVEHEALENIIIDRDKLFIAN